MTYFRPITSFEPHDSLLPWGINTPILQMRKLSPKKQGAQVPQGVGGSRDGPRLRDLEEGWPLC